MLVKLVSASRAHIRLVQFCSLPLASVPSAARRPMPYTASVPYNLHMPAVLSSPLAYDLSMASTPHRTRGLRSRSPMCCSISARLKQPLALKAAGAAGSHIARRADIANKMGKMVAANFWARTAKIGDRGNRRAMLHTNRLVLPVAQAYTSITPCSYSVAGPFGQFPPRLVQPVKDIRQAPIADTNRLMQPVAHGSYTAAVSAGRFHPRLAQPINFPNGCIGSATIGGQWQLTQIGWCSRLLKLMAVIPWLFQPISCPRGWLSRSMSSTIV